MEEGLSFTELVYGVVIGSAFTQFTGLELTARNGFLLVALFLILNDYLLYHHEARDIPSSGDRVIPLFWFDMTVLLAWYGVVLAASRGAAVYLYAVSVFYAVTALWETVFGGEEGWKRLLARDWLLAGGALAVASADLGAGATRTAVWLLPLAVFGCYWPDWRRLWRAEELQM